MGAALNFAVQRPVREVTLLLFSGYWREYHVNDSKRDAAILRRAAFFARASGVAAIIIFAAALAQLWPQFRLVVKQAEMNQTTADTFGLIMRLAGAFISNGIYALTLIGAGVLALALCRVAYADSSPSWAVVQDPLFSRSARRFAVIAEWAAWLYLAVNLVGFGNSTIARLNDLAAADPSATGAVMQKVIPAVYMGTAALMATLHSFFIVVLGALIVRTLLVISAQASPGAASLPREGHANG